MAGIFQTFLWQHRVSISVGLTEKRRELLNFYAQNMCDLHSCLVIT